MGVIAVGFNLIYPLAFVIQPCPFRLTIGQVDDSLRIEDMAHACNVRQDVQSRVCGNNLLDIKIPSLGLGLEGQKRWE